MKARGFFIPPLLTQLYLITVKSQDFSQLDEVYWISLIAISFSDFLKPVFLSIEAESEGIGNFQ